MEKTLVGKETAKADFDHSFVSQQRRRLLGYIYLQNDGNAIGSRMAQIVV